MLELSQLSKTFGGVQAVKDVSLTIAKGERHALIGPNGAGKTTLFNLIAGSLTPTSGEIVLAGRRVTRLKPFERARLGVGRTFQHNTLFANLSVFENVRLAAQRSQGQAFHGWRAAQAYDEVNVAALGVLEQLELVNLATRNVNTLAYGQQRVLEIALALASNPKLLLLDEPTAGMSVAETQTITGIIQNLDQDLTLIIIEHDMEVVLDLAERVTVLHHGELLTQGTPAQIQANADVQRVYLGEGEHD